MLKIEFTADHGDESEARAIVAALVNLYGSTVLPSSAPAQPTHEAPAIDGFPVPETDRPAPVGNVDTAGTPWDERIHASTKTTNKDGTWTRRRNTPDEVFDAVMAELRGVAEPTAAEAFTPPPTVVIAPAPAPVPGTAAAVPPVPQPVTVAAPAAPTAPAGGEVTFVDLMRRVTPLQAAGKLTAESLAGLLAQCGLENLGKLAAADGGTRAAFGALLAQLEA